MHDYEIRECVENRALRKINQKWGGGRLKWWQNAKLYIWLEKNQFKIQIVICHAPSPSLFLSLFAICISYYYFCFTHTHTRTPTNKHTLCYFFTFMARFKLFCFLLFCIYLYFLCWFRFTYLHTRRSRSFVVVL